MHSKSKHSSSRTFAIAAILIGILLLMGATSFLFVTLLIDLSAIPRAFRVAAIVQFVMAILTIVSGLLILKEVGFARWMFLATLVVVFANLIYLFVSMFMAVAQANL